MKAVFGLLLIVSLYGMVGCVEFREDVSEFENPENQVWEIVCSGENPSDTFWVKYISPERLPLENEILICEENQEPIEE